MIPLGVLASSYVVPAGGTVIDDFAWEWRFEADSITGVSNGGLIATWPDTSGNSRDASNGYGPGQPRFDADAFGSVPGVSYAETNRSLSTAEITALAQPSTVWHVSTGNPHGPIYNGVNSSYRHFFYLYGGTYRAYAGADGEVDTGLSTVNGVVATRYNGSSSDVWVNGGTPYTGKVGTHGLTGLKIGSTGAATIGAILVINASQSTADLNTVGNYLADKFGFTWTDIT